MSRPTDREIAAALVGIISDGFNRSLTVLVDAGLLDMGKFRQHYKGIGSKYYDLVTAQIEHSANVAIPGLRKLFDGDQTKTTWTVWRIDDNANSFIVRSGLPREEAERIAAEFASHGHKQTYWIEPDAAATTPPT